MGFQDVRGFALLEAALSVAIVGLASAAALGAVAAQARAAAAAAEHVRGAALAEYAFTDLRIRAWTGEFAEGRTVPVPVPAEADSAAWAPYSSVTRLVDGPDSRLLEATVVVRWPNGERRIQGLLPRPRSSP